MELCDDQMHGRIWSICRLWYMSRINCQICFAFLKMLFQYFQGICGQRGVDVSNDPSYPHKENIYIWHSASEWLVSKVCKFKMFMFPSSCPHRITVVVSIVLVLLDLCNPLYSVTMVTLVLTATLNINKMLMIANLQCYMFSYYADGNSIKSWVRKGKLRDTSWCNGRPFDLSLG